MNTATLRVNYKENNLKVANVSKNQVQIWANIEFGMLSANCKNFGICKIHLNSFITKPDFEKKRCQCNNSFSAIFLSKKGELEMLFMKAFMSKKVIKKYFSTKFFQIDEAFQVPTDISDLVDISAITIKKGYYPITETEGFYIVKYNNLTHNR